MYWITHTHSLSLFFPLSLSHTHTHYKKINIIIIIIKNNTTKAHLWEVKSFFHACTTFGSLKRHKIAIPYNSLKSPKNSLSNTPFKTGFAGFSDNRRNNLTPELEVSDSWGGAGNWGLTWLDQKLTSTSFRCGTKSETTWKRNQKERLGWSLETDWASSPFVQNGGHGGSMSRASASRSHDQRFESRPEHKKNMCEFFRVKMLCWLIVGYKSDSNFPSICTPPHWSLPNKTVMKVRHSSFLVKNILHFPDWLIDCFKSS